MKTLVLATLLGGTLASQAVSGPVITASCFRGPWKEVIWDRANPAFVSSLIEAGYSAGTAVVIADRICRNPALVNHPDAMIQAVKNTLETTPKDSR